MGPSEDDVGWDHRSMPPPTPRVGRGPLTSTLDKRVVVKVVK